MCSNAEPRWLRAHNNCSGTNGPSSMLRKLTKG
jgi:hypothetical protein